MYILLRKVVMFKAFLSLSLSQHVARCCCRPRYASWYKYENLQRTAHAESIYVLRTG